MGLFGFFSFIGLQKSINRTHTPHTQCKHLQPAPVPHFALKSSLFPNLSLLRASKCWTGATWAIYFISWYALPVGKLRWRGLGRNFWYKEAWPRLLQRTQDSEEKWGHSSKCDVGVSLGSGYCTRIQWNIPSVSHHSSQVMILLTDF